MNDKKNDFSVSVVVPFYNRSKYLKRLLDSVYDQSCVVSAVFVIDNGSDPDDAEIAWSIINDHSISNVCCFVSTTKCGNANYARNLGYNYSTSRFVAYLDSDDWWEPGHLVRSINLLERTGKAGCYSGAIIHTPEGKRIARSVDIDTVGCPFKFFFSGCGGSAQTSSFVVSKEIIKDSVEWDENLKRSQDHDYFISIQTKTVGWVYKAEANYNIDWEQGGTQGPVDADSIVSFYKKWSSEFPRGLELRFILKYISVFEARGMNEKVEKLVESVSFSWINRIVLSGPVLYSLRLFLRLRLKLRS